MSDSVQSGKQNVIIGISLVIVGLLAGILGMLFLGANSEGVVNRPQVVERVELGTPLPNVSNKLSDEALANAKNDARSLSLTFQSVAENVKPAVVFIEVELGSEGGSAGGWFRGMRSPRVSVGSGVVISKEGYIVTNNHVVADASKILVTLDDKRQYPAHIVGTDNATDLAVIKMETDEVMPVVPFGNSDEVYVGEWVIAVGNPFRLTSTVTAGIVSALGRQVDIIDDQFSVEDFIQTDAAINPGNSGGALVNLGGELVGINTAIATESGSYEGYGFAVPVNLVYRVAADLIETGSVQRGYLGVSIVPVTPDLAREFGFENVRGVILEEVTRGGSADRAGLIRGDIVLNVNGRPVNAPNELQRAIALHRPGDLLDIEVWREGSLRNFDVNLIGADDPVHQRWLAELQEQQSRIEERLTPSEPEPGASAFEIQEWGMGIRDLSERARERFGGEEGVFVAYVRNGGLADRAGLSRGVVLFEINGTPVNSVESALTALALAKQGEKSVLFGVVRMDGRRSFYEAEHPGVEAPVQ